MRDHVRLVAFLHIALGVLGLVVGLGVLTLLGGMAFFTGGLANFSAGGASVATAIFAAPAIE